MAKFKCKDCTERYPGCHDKCKAYQDVKSEMYKVKTKIRSDQEQHYDILYRIESMVKHKKF